MVMGIRPFLGKFFAPGDDQRHAAAAVLTYSCWKRWGTGTADLSRATVLQPDQINTARFLVAILITAALLTLLIACGNVANLLLALAAQRRQEALIKTALGASRMRLIGEFLKETDVLC